MNGACAPVDSGVDVGADTAADSDASLCTGVLCDRCGEPCDTGNGCEVGVVDCSAGRAECVRARLRDSGFVCRPSAGLCDVPESCDGASPDCPPDEVAEAGVECRPTAGPCDVAESCDGMSASCPPDDFLASGECRPAAGECDVAESCDGTGPSCPPDRFAPTVTTCSSPVAPSYPCRIYRCAGDAPRCEFIGDRCSGRMCCEFGCGFACVDPR